MSAPVAPVPVLSALLLVLVLFASVAAPQQAHAEGEGITSRFSNTWLAHADTSWYDGSGSYTISTAAQLAGLALLVDERSGVQFAGSTFTLANDIDLSAYPWYPIGNNEFAGMAPSFGGTFDGAGHTISGMHIEDNSINMGLFGYTEGGLIQNLTVRGTVVAFYDAAGVVVHADGTSFYRVNNYVDVTTTSLTNGNAGGIVGNFVSTNTDPNHEGFFTVYMQECVNYGTIRTASAYGGVGGVAGALYEEGGTFYLIRCHNLGQVVAGASHVADMNDLQATGVGGVVGATVNKGDCHFQECTNEAAVSSADPYSSTGGIVGYLAGGGSGSSVLYSYNVAPVSGYGVASGGVAGNVADGQATLAFTYNAGEVAGAGAAALVSQRADGVKMKTNYYVEGTAAGAFGSGEDEVSRAEQRTFDEMRTQATLDALNDGGTKDYYSIEDDKNNGLPIVGGTKHPGKGGTGDAGDDGTGAALAGAGITADSLAGGSGDGAAGVAVKPAGEDAASGAAAPSDSPATDAGPSAAATSPQAADPAAAASAASPDPAAAEAAADPGASAERYQMLKLADVEQDTPVVQPDLPDWEMLAVAAALAAVALWGAVWRSLDFYTQRGRPRRMAMKQATA